MRTVVVGAAPADGGDGFYRELLSGSDCVVASDGGGLLCLRVGVLPTIAVGDFDSAGAGGMEALERAGVPLERHPAAKDATDLQLAVAAARRLGARELTLTAAFTDRLDHTLAALGVLLDAADLEAEAREPGWSAWALDARTRPSLALACEVGTMVSLIAPEGAAGITTCGLVYPLEDADLPPLSGLGISNVTTLGSVEVRVSGGRLLVFAEHPDRSSPEAR